ncbi:uncharacterized protein H6S33_007852 [Morchella sextelata]|uniref:uncharacterized protein n=1 Tax=Morchella sextelata TaxID=1174677 RepID=UPI001D04A860|nr:uncharacterized protein H6S33_007852 [Morchella sextelata]KAH0603530.1 hypothetical protein H6S33_007852 [Morchella sextelata]
MDCIFEQNHQRMRDIIASVAAGTTTASAAAATLFHWLDDIVNERCPPYENFGYKTSTGDTPRVNEFSTCVGVNIVDYACLREARGMTFDERETHERLADLAREWWKLLGTRKWISRGYPMATSDNWMLDNLCNIFPDRDCYTKFPKAERDARKNKDIISYYRIIATLDERGGLDWLRGGSAAVIRPIQNGDPSDISIHCFAHVMEIMGKTLYNTREDFWVPATGYVAANHCLETVVREKGYCEVNWQPVLAVVTRIAEDQDRTEEIRDVARKTAERMVRIEEEVKQEREAKRLEEEAKNPKKEEEEKPRNEEGEVGFRTYVKNWSVDAPAS